MRQILQNKDILTSVDEHVTKRLAYRGGNWDRLSYSEDCPYIAYPNGKRIYCSEKRKENERG